MMMDRIGAKLAAGMGMAMFYCLLFLGIGWANGMETIETRTLFIHLVVANIIGMIFSVASFIFEKEEWSLLKQTMVHFIILLGSFLPVSVWMGWIPNHVSAILICVGIFIIVYFIIWFVMTIYWKKKIESLNHQLK